MRRARFALVLALVSSCRGAGKAGNDLVIALPAGPSSLAPNAANEEFTISILGNVYETLVNLDAVLGLEPGLAESWQTPDDFTWIFRLREGARFHDGRLLEARDVVASLERARKDPASAMRAYLAPVRSIEAPDARTVVVRSERPFDLLPARLTNVFIWADPSRPGDPALGTGPYRIRSWTPGGTTVLEAFAGYRARPAIPLVEFRAIPDAERRVRQLREGRVDLALDVPAEAMASLSDSPTLKTAAMNGLRVIFLAMDCAHATSPHVDVKDNPFRDPRVRRAVALAIDREALVKGPLGGFGGVVDQIASPQEIGGHEESLAERPYDPFEARRLLSGAGHGRGFTVDLDYFSKYRSVEAVVKALAEQLAKVEIRVVPRTGTTAEVSGRIEARDTAFYLAGWVTDTGESGSSYEVLLHSPGRGFGMYNGGGYSDPDVDRLIEESSRARSGAERTAILTRIAQKVHADVPVIPLYRQADLYAMARDLELRPRLDRRIWAIEMSWKGGVRAKGARPGPGGQ